jgi:hypothetical protein
MKQKAGMNRPVLTNDRERLNDENASQRKIIVAASASVMVSGRREMLPWARQLKKIKDMHKDWNNKGGMKC